MADPIDTGKKTVTGRTIWRDPETDEDYSERSTTFEIDGKYYTMPTVAEDGTQYTEDQIRDYVKEYGPTDFITGEELPEFRNREDAIEYAISRSDTRKQEEEPMFEEQMEMFNEGGLRDEGGTVDPDSGNDVPIGSTKEEVRDDIPAMLSEGEFVLPADVVRYIGLENLMKLRQDAKMGLKQMEAMGQMGNSEEATMPDDMPFGPADLVILGKPQEDELREMNQGGIATGIGGYQPSVFQNQVPMTAGFTPPSSVAPPTPTPAPTGGYIPSFVYNESIPTTVSGTPVTTPPPVVSTPVTATQTPTEDKFVPTAEDQYYGIQYINEATGEIRTFYFYQGNPVTPIPDGFVPYNPPTDDGLDGSDGSDGSVTGNGTDGSLGGAGVDTTSVRGDDLSGTKKRLEDMVRDQGGNRLSQIRKDFAEGNKAKAEKDLVSLYLQNEKTKSLMTALGLLNPVALVGRGFSQIYGKQLEKLMTEQGIEIPEIDAGFFENLKGAVSDITGTGEAQPEVYNPLYDPSDSPLTTVSGAKNMLTSNEAKAYDNAVKTGNARVAEHYEIINNRLNKMSLAAKMAGGDKEKLRAEGLKMGLSKFDIEQAQKMLDSTGNKKGLADSGLAKKSLDTQTESAFPSGISGDDPYSETQESSNQIYSNVYGRPGMEQIDLSGMGAGAAQPSVQTDIVSGDTSISSLGAGLTQEDIIEKQREAAREAAAAERRKDRRRERSKAAAKAAADRRKTAVKKAKSISKSVKGKGASAVSATRKAGAFAKGGLASRK